MRHLLEAPTLAEASRAISRRPPEIDTVWDQAISWVSAQPKLVTKYKFKVLNWLVYATRPLTTVELQHAIAIQEECQEPREDDLPNMDVLQSEFRGIMYVDENGLPRLAHRSVLEHLIAKEREYFPYAEQQVLETCITALSSASFEQGPCSTDDIFDLRVLQHPFYNYAAKNWGRHASNLASSDDFLLHFLRDDRKRSASVQALMVSGRLPGYSQNVPKLWTAIHMMAYFGLHAALTKWSQEVGHHGANTMDSYGRAPLSWAAENGHLDVVRQLISSPGVDSGLSDHAGRAPMWYATRQGHEEVLTLLLEAIPGSEDGSLREQVFKSIFVAAEHGHAGSLGLLMRRDHVEPDMKDDTGRTPLWVAAENGHAEAATVLLQLGASPIEPDNYSHRPLPSAAARGHAAVVEVLLHAVGPISEDEERSLIQRAAENGHAKVVALLVQKSGDAGETANIWRWAVDTESWPVLGLLVERDGFVDENVGDGRTILTLASQMGQELVVDRILDLHPQKMNEQDMSGRLPLSLAVEFGHTAVVRVLVEKFQADLNQKDAGGELPILLAVRENQPEVFSLLLDYGATAPASAGGRPLLSLVAESGSREMVQNLVKRPGIDVNACDDTQRTPLSRAAEHGNDELMRCLLEQDGILVNAPDVKSWTPLFWAVKNGCTAAAILLVNKVESVNHADTDGRTALHVAVMYGKESLASILLSNPTIRVDALDNDGKTPLLMALEDANTRQDLIRKLAEKDTVTLHIMARQDKHELIAPLASAGYDLNKLDFRTGTPMQEAIRQGKIAFLESLIAAGADTEHWDFYGRTPLQLAIHQTLTDRSDDTSVQALLKCPATMTGVSAKQLRDIFMLGDLAILTITETAEKGHLVNTPQLGAGGTTLWPAKANALTGRRLW